LAPAQRNRMNDQPIFVDQTGGNEALSEPSAAMRKDEFARLAFQSNDFLREITACHHGFSPGLQDRRCRRDALPFPNAILFCIGERACRPIHFRPSLMPCLEKMILGMSFIGAAKGVSEYGQNAAIS